VSDTYTAWSFMLGDRAYKHVVPKKIEIFPHMQKRLIKTKFLFFKTYQSMPTGMWNIHFTYNRGPFTVDITDIIPFNDEKTARAWYDATFRSVFLGQDSVPQPPTPKPEARLALTVVWYN
jgi:hypothetical protein